MSSLLTLPRSTTPRLFFDDILSSELARVTVPPGTSPSRFQINIMGTGGGTWNVGTHGDGLAVFQGAASSPPLQVTLTENDWREVLFGSVRDRLLESLGGADRVKGSWSPQLFARLCLTDSQVQRIQQFPGDLQLEIDDRDEASQYRVTMTIGGGAPNFASPKSKLVIPLDVWVGMVTQRANPQEAFFQGKIRLVGDPGLPMGLMSVLMAR